MPAQITDIFLSPVKPATKSSVSAEAINASLYYVHVATPEDEALLEEVEQEREEEALRKRKALEAAAEEDPSQRDFVRMNNVRRKPVGGQEAVQAPCPPLPLNEQQQNAAPSLPPRPVPMPAVSAENMSFQGTPVAASQPLEDQRFATTTTTTTITGEPVNRPALPRRPLPPLPPSEDPFGSQPEEPIRKTNRWSHFADGLHGKGFDAWKEKYESFSAGRHSFDSSRPPLPPRPSSERPWSSHSPGQSPNRNRRQVRDPLSDAGFTITLIRRDPTSGTQWNVATISTPRADSSAIDIEISTPGYNRFAGSQEPLSLAGLGANLPASLPPELIRAAGASMSQSIPKDQPSEQQTGPRKFHRQVCVSRQFDDVLGTGNSSSDFGTGHGHDASSKLKSGYYTFNSPWNGTCTFSSSVNGRSLKCKHMISGPANIPTQGEGDPNPAVTVAELRFNTPFQAANIRYQASQAHHPHQSFTSNTSTHPHLHTHASNEGMLQDPDTTSKRGSLSQLLNPNNFSRQRAHSGSNSSPTDTQRASFNPSALMRRTSQRASRFARQNQFGHSYPRRSTSTSSGGDSDEDRLDLSLARELAGGGLRGKSAKLGKLVIEDEGFKMLDLVVAACMAVWWRGYYH